MSTPLLQVRGLVKTFPAGGRQRVHALRGIDLDLERRCSLGLVGESGCGKSTLARCIVRLVQPDAGRIVFDSVDLARLGRRRLRPVRRRLQMVFQDPLACLDPRMTVEQLVAEPLCIHRLARGRALRRERVAALMNRVGLSEELLPRYPHQLSAGQRQRVGIGRALAVAPELIVADEPVSALDLPIQAQIMNLLLELQQAEGLAYLFISHDMAVVRHLCDEVAVMYLGRVVEQGPAQLVADQPAHPYSCMLRDAALPRSAAALAAGELTSGEPPSPLAPPPGCAFHPRCPVYRQSADERCRTQAPALTVLRSSHRVACHAVAAGTPENRPQGAPDSSGEG